MSDGTLTPDDLRIPEVVRRIDETWKAGESWVGTYRCDNCRFPNQVCFLPWSPREAKHRCRRCDHTNSVILRDSASEKMDEFFAEGMDVRETAKRTSVVVDGRRAMSKRQQRDMVAAKLIEAAKKVD